MVVKITYEEDMLDDPLEAPPEYIEEYWEILERYQPSDEEAPPI